MRMSLPFPPPLPLPMPPAVVEDMEVTAAGFNRLEVCVGSITLILTRTEAFRLIGLLERGASEI
jgi:hypothetical protein